MRSHATLSAEWRVLGIEADIDGVTLYRSIGQEKEAFVRGPSWTGRR